MKALARFCLLLLTGSATAAGAYGFWTQSVSFPPDNPSFYGLSMAPLVIAILGLIGSFAPFDNPKAALRWASTLVGLACGVALGGLVLFTPSFLWLAGPLLIYAFLTHTCARVVSGVRRAKPEPRAQEAAKEKPEPEPEPEPEADSKADTDISIPDSKATTRKPPSGEGAEAEEEGLDPSDPYGHGTTFMANRALDDSDETAGQTRGVRTVQVLFAALGVALCFAWRPSAGAARPDPLEVVIEPAFSAPGTRRITKRIIRETDRIELSGMRVQVQASLRRPRLIVEQHRQTLVVEPCLLVEEGSVDGFFAIPRLNTYSLEPGWNSDEPGLAQVEFVEGQNRGWVRIEYNHGRVRYPANGLAAMTPGLGGRAAADDISAVVELEVNFDTGRVTIDAVTRLGRSVAVHAATLCFIEVKSAGDAPLELGLGGETARWLLPERENGRWPKRLSFLSHDGKVARLLRGKRGDQGPYEMLQVGTFDGWLSLPGEFEPILVVAPDWTRQASFRSSRGAGHGLSENALLGYRQGKDVHLLFDLASTRIGPSRITTELPSGLYRNRLVLLPLGKATPSVVAERQLERIGVDPSAEAVSSPASGSNSGTPAGAPGSHRPG